METKKSKRPQRDRSRFTMRVGKPEEYVCDECYEQTTIFRNPPHTSIRDIGHKKHIWCLKCRRAVVHTKVSRA